MKTKLTLTLASLALAHLPCVFAQQRLTSDDPNFRQLLHLSKHIGWYQNAPSGSWSVGDVNRNHEELSAGDCKADLDKVQAAGVPDTRGIDIEWDGPEFKHGRHTLAEIRVSCEHVERVKKVQEFERWAIASMHDTSYKTPSEPDYRNCIKVYNEIVQKGISPSEHVAERMVGELPWSGTITELREKWCDTGLQASTQAADKVDAPFRRHLKGDRLDIALRYHGAYLPGGIKTVSARQMAAVSVWFIEFLPRRYCNDGRQIHLMRRYQFGPAEELIKKSEQEFCGPAPLSSFQ